MRTTLDLPEELLFEAMELTKITTKTKVIITALEDLIRQHKITEIKNYRGKVELDIDLDSLRGMKCIF
ncbi:hypothetical protein CSB45_14005 [candidate division KSB3 bacterium]|uniref:DUF2191 domain-containing protein n=1 Tax=candidate division KSB3 bacterium TaxID=2044937 RepID=A0A2G6E1A5_9BACT|nr:MAG: hypothetical protein CSB45_14005 [candidate division KSB3 bacterium]PIE28440.1 MAG: hypothetical protein CSA57_13650 [candidate division KSB3 bacterium]